MTTKTIEKKVNNLSREVAYLRNLVERTLANNNLSADSFEFYKNPKTLKASFKRALKDWQTGRVQTRL